jgi:predicted amidohydrolase YtcJ
MENQADHIVLARTIITMDNGLPRAEALAVSGGTVVAAGRCPS